MKKIVWFALIIFAVAGCFGTADAAQLFNYPKFSSLTTTGTLMAGGKLYTYEPGTTTPKAAYKDRAKVTAHANPIVLDSNGEETVFLDGRYKIVLKNSAGVTKWTMDNVEGISSFYFPPYEVDVLETYGGGTSQTDTAINAAMTALGASNNYTLVLRAGTSSGTWTLSNNVTITSNVTLKIVPGADVSGAFTLTINGKAVLPNEKVFDPTITVTFAVGSVPAILPEWWGITGTSDQTAINKALIAGNCQIPVRGLPGKLYYASDAVLLKRTSVCSGTKITEGMILEDMHLISRINDASAAVIVIGDKTALTTTPERGHKLKNITVDGSNAYPADAIQTYDLQDFLFEDLYLRPKGIGVFMRGITIAGAISGFNYMADLAEGNYDEITWGRTANWTGGIILDSSGYRNAGAVAGSATTVSIDCKFGWIRSGQYGIKVGSAGNGAYSIDAKNCIFDGGPNQAIYYDTAFNSDIQGMYGEQSDASNTQSLYLKDSRRVNVRNWRHSSTGKVGESVYITGSNTSAIDLMGIQGLSGSANFTITADVPTGAVVSPLTSATGAGGHDQQDYLRTVSVADRTIYVATTGVDTATGRDASNPVLTIQAAIDRIPQYLKHDYTVSVGAGSFNATVTLANFDGPGSITITGDASTTTQINANNSFIITDCQVRIKFIDLIAMANGGAGIAFDIRRSNNVWIDNVKIGEGATGDNQGVYATDMSRVYVSRVANLSATEVQYCLVATTGSQVHYASATVPNTCGDTFTLQQTGGRVFTDTDAP